MSIDNILGWFKKPEDDKDNEAWAELERQREELRSAFRMNLEALSGRKHRYHYCTLNTKRGHASYNSGTVHTDEKVTSDGLYESMRVLISKLINVPADGFVLTSLTYLGEDDERC